MKIAWLVRIIFLLCLSLGVSAKERLPVIFEEGPQLRYFNQLQQAGLVMMNAQQEPLYEKNAQQFFIPASTTKLITALLALQHWGENYRFKTEFYLTERENVASGKTPPMLLVKGYGDPFLISEELAFMAKQLANRLQQQGITSLAGIQIDASYYQGGIKFSGASQTDNPYDAIPSALAANFNTVYIQKTAEGFVSAEMQTPMTQTALALAKNINAFEQTKTGLKKRINLGQNEITAQRYFAELLRAFLRLEGIAITDHIEWQALKETKSTRLYQHRNRQTLADVVRPMMKYSTNFVANQLALNLSQEMLGGAASAEKVAQAYHQRLTELFAWSQFTLKEGAGLSRQNRLSPVQLIDVLNAFQPWRHLLPEIEPDVYAKSGTLLGVSTLAGYLYKEAKWHPFVVMINQKVPYRYRNKLAKELSTSF